MQHNGASRIIAVVQARMSSRRLPGKVLRPVAGKPLLAHLLDRLAAARALDGIAVATSDQADDNAVADFADSLGVRCIRGPLHDVLGRYARATDLLDAAAVVRICGDSPLLHPRLIDRAVELFLSERPDMVTNVFPRTFPKGQSVEVLSRSALRRACCAAATDSDREHVTPWLYAHADQLNILNFASDDPAPDLQMAVDTIEDHQLVEQLLQAVGPGASTAPLSELVHCARRLWAGQGAT